MVRLIVLYHIYRIVHDCIDETHVEYRQRTVSREPPPGLVQTHALADTIQREELLANDPDLDRVVRRSSVCRQKDHPDSVAAIPVECQPLVTSCEDEYWFAWTAYLVEPRWSQYKLEYDEVTAAHDGYCSDAEVDWKVEPLSVCAYAPIEPERLGVDEDEEQVVVTPARQGQFALRHPVVASHGSHGCRGSGYCLIYNDIPSEFDGVSECNTPYYILRQCTRVE